MNTFYPRYDVEMKGLVFPEYKKNKCIEGKMVYVIDYDYK